MSLSLSNPRNYKILSVFETIFKKNFYEFVEKIPFSGFPPPGVHYCVLRSQEEARNWSRFFRPFYKS